MTEPKHTPGPMTARECGQELLLPKENYWSFEVGCGYYNHDDPEKHKGFGVTAFIRPADAARLKLCWDSHDVMLAALKVASERFAELGEELAKSAVARAIAIAINIGKGCPPVESESGGGVK